jgi:hypothetical protein
MYISINQYISNAVMFVSRSHLCIDHWICLLDIIQRQYIFSCPTNHWTCLLQKPGMFTCPTNHWTCLLQRHDMFTCPINHWTCLLQRHGMFTCLTNHWTCLLQRHGMFTCPTNHWACLLQMHDMFTCRSTIVLTATTSLNMYDMIEISTTLNIHYTQIWKALKVLHDCSISLREEDYITNLTLPLFIEMLVSCQ